MLYKTISKNSVFVISILFVCLSITSCDFVFSSEHNKINQNKKQFSDQFEKPQILGTIKSKEIKESSGIIQSRCNTDAFWTHNDSGDDNFIYALDKNGGKLGTWKVEGAKNNDWEDIAILKNKKGECYIFIGDIGNNARTRSEMTIYRVKEPIIEKNNGSSSQKKPISTEKADTINFTYPDMRHDAETLLIQPETEDIYVLTKSFSGASGVYKLSDYKLGQINSLELIGKVSVPALPNGLLTGGEISSDGSRIILCDYYNGYELVLPKNSKKFDDIWKDEPSIIDLGKREQGESVCYSIDAEAIYATSEKKNSPFIEVRRKE